MLRTVLAGLLTAYVITVLAISSFVRIRKPIETVETIQSSPMVDGIAPAEQPIQSTSFQFN